LYILYAHLDQPPLVELRERVASCQQLGEVGMSGNTDIPHLHIESRLGPAGQVFESMRFYDTRASQEEMDAYVLWRTSGIFQHFDPLQLLDLVEMPEGTPVGE
jgi:murein DD-endopeptidase MepM/ murein hydrolase activator NlpD